MKPARRIGLVAVGVAATVGRAQEAHDWTVMPSDGVKASVSLIEGAEGRGLRLHYNFEAGAGFVVLRRPAPPELAAGVGDHFRFTFQVRGQGPRNNLEFKLVDPTGDNVWWLNQRAYEWSAHWKQERLPERKLTFAWGPLGATSASPRPTNVGFIEFAVAASEGGEGTVDLDTLTFEAMPPPAPVTHVPAVIQRTDREIDIDFRQVREFGGLMLDWDAQNFPVDYTILSSSDSRTFTPIAAVRGARGGRRFLPLPDAQARAVRLVVERANGTAARLAGVEVLPVDFGSSENAMFREIAAREDAGVLPRYFRDEQSYWTVVGVPGSRDEALLSADGAIEVGTGGFTLEPFLVQDGRVISWADVTRKHSLEEGYLPIPTVTWLIGDLRLDVQCMADGNADASTVVGRYRVENTGSSAVSGSFVLAIRPFQVLPPWQNLNITGGVSRIESLAIQNGWISVNGHPRVRPLTRPDSFGATTFAAGEIAEWWRRGHGPGSTAAIDPMRLASGALEYAFQLEPGASASFSVEALLRPSPPHVPRGSVDDRFAAVAGVWKDLLNRVRLTLPESAQRLSDTFRTTQAYILINQDGPAIQPGSRTYERSWMRDGSMTGATLLYTGHQDEMTRFVEWYAAFQYPDGKVPCVVDRRGPDPVPEHDSHGELIYAIWTTYRYTGDRAFLERMWPRITGAVDYIESLRRQRMTEAYRSGPVDNRAMYGLVPESISHEGYSAKAMHSYWDSFFVVKGLKDAESAARELGRDQDAARIGTMLEEYRSALYSSMALAMATRGIDYIPGCVELGDFDATSTAIGSYPCGELAFMPRPAVERTFDKYFEFFVSRRDGNREWKDYTPYEIRLAGTYLRLGRPERAHDLIEYFFQHQRPPAWNQWAEVVWREADAPRFIGDMPHTWVGSEFLQVVRSMFVFEQDQTLVIGAGVRPEWPWDGVGASVESFPTEFGPLTCTWKGDGDTLRVGVSPGLRPGVRRCVLVLPEMARSVRIGGQDSPIETLNWTASARGVWWDGRDTLIEVKVER
jgi:hypothetical protein